jgi:hypothetical protein
MMHILPEDYPELGGSTPLSPLMLADRLISLAKEVDQVGLPEIAEQLVRLACDVLESWPLVYRQ